jgi:sigma-B regulation protein RsbU (phosphoserine phosphatase)
MEFEEQKRRNWTPGWTEKIFFALAIVLLGLQFFDGLDGLKLGLALAAASAGFVVIFRLGVFALRQAIWRLSNRLIVTHLFIAVIPILLLALFAEAGAWVLSSQFGAYLLNGEMERRVTSLKMTAQGLSRAPVAERVEAVKRAGFLIRERFPGAEILLKDPSGAQFRYPEDAKIEAPPEGFGETAGVVVRGGYFHIWAHAGGPRSEVVMVAPITKGFLRGLVPQLGDVTLRSFVTSGAGSPQGIHVHTSAPGETPPPAVSEAAAANLLDLPVRYGVSLPVRVWESPQINETALLGMRTRISGVLNVLFNQSLWAQQGTLLEVLLGLGIAFLVVEMIAAFVGISLTRAITNAVHNLYEGTQRVKEGDLSHRIEVSGHDQLSELSRSFNSMTENLERLLRSERERQRLQAELEIAREVQAQLHPRAEREVGSLRVSYLCHAARMVSGDYFDYQPVGQDRMAMAIGDVAGKGISAALLMATLQSAMRSQLRHCMEIAAAAGAGGGNGHGQVHVSTAKLVSNLNQQLYLSTSPEKYATFFFAVYDEPASRLTYTNAGHLSPLLIRDGKAIPLNTNGTVVGAFPHVTYGESVMELEAGDLLVCYTDGITEPENEYGEMFGEERLVEVLVQNAGRSDDEIADAIVTAVKGWNSAADAQDDMTLLMARRV